jgi:hypothetical protein
MGKTKNRKRAKMMRLQKKEREALLNETESPGRREIEQRLSQKGREVLVQNSNPQVKISDVLLQMIAPLMENTNSFSEEKNVVGLGVMAWNLGIVKGFKGEDEMQNSVKQIKKQIPKAILNILLEYADIKVSEYPDYDEFIHDYEYKSVNKKHSNLTVAYKSINED